MIVATLVFLAAPGCAVVKPVVGTGKAVGKAAVKVTGKAAGAVVRTAGDVVTPDNEPAAQPPPQK